MIEVKTLKDAVPEYMAYLESQGKKKSTQYTVNLNLNLMVKHFGEEKELGKMLATHVASFFNSELATKVNGRPRSDATKLQIRRIARQFLVWANKEGLINSIPLPNDEKRFIKN